jgi:hypothetical protein
MAEEMALDPDSLLGSMLKQDQAIYMQVQQFTLFYRIPYIMH